MSEVRHTGKVFVINRFFQYQQKHCLLSKTRKKYKKIRNRYILYEEVQGCTKKTIEKLGIFNQYERSTFSGRQVCAKIRR